MVVPVPVLPQLGCLIGSSEECRQLQVLNALIAGVSIPILTGLIELVLELDMLVFLD